jgi:hypothetical protein
VKSLTSNDDSGTVGAGGVTAERKELLSDLIVVVLVGLVCVGVNCLTDVTWDEDVSVSQHIVTFFMFVPLVFMARRFGKRNKQHK